METSISTPPSISSFGRRSCYFYLHNYSLNILKVYHAIESHLRQFPSEALNFPNFDPKRKPILARGSAGPLEGELHGDEFHGRDGLNDITGRHPEISIGDQSDIHPYLEVTNRSGVDVALDILRSRPPRSVTYIVLGPLTNLALMMRKDSKLVTERIGRIVCMGGSLDVPGNVSPMAEFNFFADPYAVKELLISTPLHQGLPLNRFVLLPLDVTTPHELPFPEYKRDVDSAFHNSSLPSISHNKSPLTHFTSSFLERTREVMLQFGKDALELHDVVAVWCAIENPPLLDDAPMALAPDWQGYKRIFDIERTGEITRGMLVVDRREDGSDRSEAQNGLESTPKSVTDNAGVFCITHTPGPATLLRLLLNRVWGCEQQ